MMNRLQKCCLWLAAGLVVGLVIGAWLCHTRYTPCHLLGWDTPDWEWYGT